MKKNKLLPISLLALGILGAISQHFISKSILSSYDGASDKLTQLNSDLDTQFLVLGEFKQGDFKQDNYFKTFSTKNMSSKLVYNHPLFDELNHKWFLFLKEFEQINSYLAEYKETASVRDGILKDNDDIIERMNTLFSSFKIEQLGNVIFSNAFNNLYVSFQKWNAKLAQQPIDYLYLNKSSPNYKKQLADKQASLQELSNLTQDLNKQFKFILDVNAKWEDNKGVSSFFGKIYTAYQDVLRQVNILNKRLSVEHSLNINTSLQLITQMKQEIVIIKESMAQTKSSLDWLSYLSLLWLLLDILGIALYARAKIKDIDDEKDDLEEQLGETNDGLERLKDDIEIHREQKNYDAKSYKLPYLARLSTALNELWRYDRYHFQGLLLKNNEVGKEIFRVEQSIRAVSENYKDNSAKNQNILNELSQVNKMLIKQEGAFEYLSQNKSVFDEKDGSIRDSLTNLQNVEESFDKLISATLSKAQDMQTALMSLKNVSSLLGQLSDRAKTIAWNGNILSSKQEGGSAEIYNEINEVVQKITESIDKINSGIGSVSSEMSNIRNTMTDIRSGIKQNASTISQLQKQVELVNQIESKLYDLWDGVRIASQDVKIQELINQVNKVSETISHSVQNDIPNVLINIDTSKATLVEIQRLLRKEIGNDEKN